MRLWPIATLLLSGCFSPINGYSVTVSPDFTAEQRQAVHAGISAWHAAIPELAVSVHDGPCEDPTSICLAPDNAAMPGDVHWAGWTSPDHMHLFIATDRIAAHGYGMRTVQQTAAHELGHAMGLEHTKAGDLMAAEVGEQAHDVTDNDRAQWWATR